MANEPSEILVHTFTSGFRRFVTLAEEPPVAAFANCVEIRSVIIRIDGDVDVDDDGTFSRARSR